MIKASELADMAKRLADEGDYFSASVLCFVAALRANGDKERLERLADFASKLSIQSLEPDDRSIEEKTALTDLLKEL